jgi:predicted SprT family Zn-dependent metalloprotease
MLEQVENLCNKITSELKDQYPAIRAWTFRWNNRLRTVMGRAGISRAKGNYIELSSHLVRINRNTPDFITRIKETILHEWAHALDWEYDGGWGHGATWKKWMQKLGVPPERCFSSDRWLCALNKTKYAIRNGRTGNVMFYSNQLSPSLLLDAMTKNLKQGGEVEDIEIISLKTGDKIGR